MERLEALLIAPSRLDESALVVSSKRDEPKAIEYPTSETKQITANSSTPWGQKPGIPSTDTKPHGIELLSLVKIRPARLLHQSK